VNAECEAVRRALEEEPGRPSPEVAAHLAACHGCAAQVGLVRLLEGLSPGDGDEESARRILLDLPIAGWQLRRAAAWVPLAAGGALVGGGLLLVGGLPGGATLATLPASLYSFAAGSALDLAAVARGSADAVRAFVTAAGYSALAWLGLSALAGSLAVRALLRRSARGRA
jgi:hypothetical protein